MAVLHPYGLLVTGRNFPSLNTYLAPYKTATQHAPIRTLCQSPTNNVFRTAWQIRLRIQVPWIDLLGMKIYSAYGTLHAHGIPNSELGSTRCALLRAIKYITRASYESNILSFFLKRNRHTLQSLVSSQSLPENAFHNESFRPGTPGPRVSLPATKFSLTSPSLTASAGP